MVPQIVDLTKGLGSRYFEKFLQVLKAKRGPLMGLDVGTKHVGVAISDIGRHVAFGDFGFRRGSIEKDSILLRKKIQSESVAGVIIGMPVPQLGKSNDVLRQYIKQYSAAVLQGCDMLPIAFWDESYSTCASNEKVKEASKRSMLRNQNQRKRSIDAVAAAEILQDALDAFRSFQVNEQISS